MSYIYLFPTDLENQVGDLKKENAKTKEELQTYKSIVKDMLATSTDLRSKLEEKDETSQPLVKNIVYSE